MAGPAFADVQRAALSARGGRGRSALGFAAGAAAMYLIDPISGRRRRHLARDRALKLMRRGRRAAARKARYGEGVAEGKLHAIRSERDVRPRPQPDDVTLAHQVESALSRQAHDLKGSISVNAENGIVYLRGQVASHDRAEELASAARAVEGVRTVRNLIHPPGERAPTAEDARLL